MKESQKKMEEEGERVTQLRAELEEATTVYVCTHSHTHTHTHTHTHVYMHMHTFSVCVVQQTLCIPHRMKKQLRLHS